MSKQTELHDMHGQMIYEGDVVNWGDEKFNRIVRYYPKYLAFSLDDERQDNAYRWLTGPGDWEIIDGKLCQPNIEIRSSRSEAQL
jgi:hypothetical protein